MLADFISSHRDAIIRRAVERILKRTGERSGDRSHAWNGIDRLLCNMEVALREGRGARGEWQVLPDGCVASEHAAQRYQMGFELGDLVHDYGDLCTAITQIAEDAGHPIEVVEYRIVNLC